MAYRCGGKQKTLAFGKYPAVSLADARALRAAAKQALAAGRDPSEARAGETFADVARRWFDTSKTEWAESHSSRVWSRIERDVLPQIGSRALADIDPPMVLACLRRVESRGAIDIAKRLRQSIGSVFRFAIAEGIADRNPAADIGQALRPAPEVRHMPTVKVGALSDLVKAINGYDGEPLTRIALLFALHTFVRTNELRFAVWSEIEGDVWRIPAVRMKMCREHVVPLTDETKLLLDQVRPYSDGHWIFGGRRGPMSENRMLYALYRMGFHSRQTVHGFRSLASTALNEHGWPADHIERQLAHVEENKIRGIYNSAEYLPGRREMMRWWSERITQSAS